MKKQITRISILQSSKIVTILFMLVGIVYGLLGAAMIVGGKGLLNTIGWAYVLMPIVMPVIGFLAFVVLSAVYNLLIRWVGGIEVEVEDTEEGPDDAAATLPRE